MAVPERTYIRFVCYQHIGKQKQRYGLFQAIGIAEQSEQSAGWALKEIAVLYGWFNKNLPTPNRLQRGGWKGWVFGAP